MVVFSLTSYLPLVYRWGHKCSAKHTPHRRDVTVTLTCNSLLTLRCSDSSAGGSVVVD